MQQQAGHGLTNHDRHRLAGMDELGANGANFLSPRQAVGTSKSGDARALKIRQILPLTEEQVY